MRTKFFATILSGMLGACAAGEMERPLDLDLERSVDEEADDASAVSYSIVEYLYRNGTLFADGANALPPVQVRQAEALVPKGVDGELLLEYRTLLGETAAMFNAYRRGNCVLGVDESAGCSADDLALQHAQAFKIHARLAGIHGAFRQWTTFDTHLDPDAVEDEFLMVLLSSEIRLAMAMDLAIGVELHALGELPGGEQFLPEAQEQGVRDIAEDYYDALSIVELRYPELETKEGSLQDVAIGDEPTFLRLQRAVLEMTDWDPNPKVTGPVFELPASAQ